MYALDLEDGDYECDAALLEASGRIFKRGPPPPAPQPLSLRHELKGMPVWRELGLWEQILRRRVDDWDKGSVMMPEGKMSVIMQLVKEMGEVGMGMGEVADIMETLSGTLSLKSQILLRDQFSQLQVLLNPRARLFMKSISTWGGGGSSHGGAKSGAQSSPPLAPLKALPPAARWQALARRYRDLMPPPETLYQRQSSLASASV